MGATPIRFLNVSPRHSYGVNSREAILTLKVEGSQNGKRNALPGRRHEKVYFPFKNKALGPRKYNRSSTRVNMPGKRHDRGITIQQEADMKRRLNFGPALRLATSLIGATCIGASVQAQSPADNYPDKPIKIIVPF